LRNVFPKILEDFQRAMSSKTNMPNSVQIFQEAIAHADVVKIPHIQAYCIGQLARYYSRDESLDIKNAFVEFKRAADICVSADAMKWDKENMGTLSTQSRAAVSSGVHLHFAQAYRLLGPQVIHKEKILTMLQKAYEEGMRVDDQAMVDVAGTRTAFHTLCGELDEAKKWQKRAREFKVSNTEDDVSKQLIEFQHVFNQGNFQQAIDMVKGLCDNPEVRDRAEFQACLFAQLSYMYRKASSTDTKIQVSDGILWGDKALHILEQPKIGRNQVVLRSVYSSLADIYQRINEHDLFTNFKTKEIEANFQLQVCQKCQSPSERLTLCRCKKAYYCSEQCSQEDSTLHQKLCVT